MEFDAFISYSQTADRPLAAAVQMGLRGFGQRRGRARVLRVFRDETCLSACSNMWQSIETALYSSQWFVLLCSPEAAKSAWVSEEITAWLDKMPVERVLPVLTDGTFEWDADRRDFTADSSAVPPALRGHFIDAPHYVDLRWARSLAPLDLRDPRFRAAIASITATITGVQPVAQLPVAAESGNRRRTSTAPWRTLFPPRSRRIA